MEPSTSGTASGYKKLFLTDRQKPPEIILEIQHDQTLLSNWMIGCMYNNADGGWSSMVPTQNLVDIYELDNGSTKEDAGNY